MGSYDPARAILDRAQELCEDVDGAAIARWKADNPGSLAVGYLPVYIPRPLLTAMGCLPVSIFGGGDAIDVVRGDAYFQSYICHIPRSTIELASSGRLDGLDGMLFPSTCDVIRNLGGMWQMLTPQHFVAYLDLPQNLEMNTGGRFYADDLRRLAERLESHGARPLTDENLREAIALENDRRDAIEALDAVRRTEPWRLRASEAYMVVRAGGVLPVDVHTRLLGDFLTAVKHREVQHYDNVRVVLTGSFCEQPPLALLRTLEKSGSDIVADDLQLGLRYIDGPIEIAEDEAPVDALARAFIERGTPNACRYIGNATKGAALIESVRETNADGVIFAAASFCDPALLEQPMLEAALERAGIPYTSFKFAENTGQFQVIREQAGAFSDSVKLWGTAS